MAAEIESFHAMLRDRYVEHGLARDHADRQARLDIEGIEQVKEQVREIPVGAKLPSPVSRIFDTPGVVF